MLSSPPEKEEKFRMLRNQYGSLYAFHGSSTENWHSIVRNVLKNCSGTKLEMVGHAYGPGIYMSPFLSYAAHDTYAHADRTGMSVVAVVEVINHNINKPNAYVWTVENEDYVVTRMLLIFKDTSGRKSQITGRDISSKIRDVMMQYGVSQDSFDLSYMLTCKCHPTTVPTGTKDARSGGAVFDEKRNMIVSTCHGASGCRDVFITRLSSLDAGTTECKAGLIPFSCSSHPPVFDDDKYVYFMECSFEGNPGHRFGRIDLDTLMFEELAPLPGSRFAMTASGCCHHGRVFMADSDAVLCMYDVGTNSWSRPGAVLPRDNDWTRVRVLSDPEDDANHLYVMGYDSRSGLFRVIIDDDTAPVLESTPPVLCDKLREFLLVRGSPTELFAIAALKNGSWYCYSFSKKEWTLLPNFAPYAGAFNHNYLVYSPSAHSFYLRKNDDDNWDRYSL